MCGTERQWMWVLCCGMALMVAAAGCDSRQGSSESAEEQAEAAATEAPTENETEVAAPEPAEAVNEGAQEQPEVTPQEAEAVEPVGAVNEVVPPGPDADPFLTEEDFVMRWRVLGPFTFDAADFGGGDQPASADELFVEDEAGLTGGEAAPDGTYWHEATFEGNVQAGQVDLDALYDGINHAAAYAVAYLYCPQPIENATLWVGSDDYIKVWINGELVHSYGVERRGSDWDQDEVSGVSMQEGYNRVVVKCVDVVGGWDFYFRLDDAEQNPYMIRPREPQPQEEESAAEEEMETDTEQASE